MILSLLLWQRLMVATDCPKIAICQRSTTVVQFTCNEQVAGSNPVVGFRRHSPMAEAVDLKSIQSEFESRWDYYKYGYEEIP